MYTSVPPSLGEHCLVLPILATLELMGDEWDRKHLTWGEYTLITLPNAKKNILLVKILRTLRSASTMIDNLYVMSVALWKAVSWNWLIKKQIFKNKRKIKTSTIFEYTLIYFGTFVLKSHESSICNWIVNIRLSFYRPYQQWRRITFYCTYYTVYFHYSKADVH